MYVCFVLIHTNSTDTLVLHCDPSFDYFGLVWTRRLECFNHTLIRPRIVGNLPHDVVKCAVLVNASSYRCYGAACKRGHTLTQEIQTLNLSSFMQGEFPNLGRLVAHTPHATYAYVLPAVANGRPRKTTSTSTSNESWHCSQLDENVDISYHNKQSVEF